MAKDTAERNAIAVESPYLVPFDGSFRIERADTKPPKKSRNDARNEAALAKAIERVGRQQARLMANDRKALLVVFQAMDAAGKDGTIKAVMTGVNPAGVDVRSFKQPSALELDHDFLWRIHRALPERGRIGIFNRSHYEEVLVVRVHPSILDAQRLPTSHSRGQLFEERYESIRDFERHVARNGTTIIKFFLHVSKDEQKQRFLERIDDHEANWKFSAADVGERQHFDRYMQAYQRALNETSAKHAPWYCIPADDKRFMRRAVAEILADTLDAMDVHYPIASEEAARAMADAKAKLLRE